MTTQILLPGFEPAQKPNKSLFFAIFPDSRAVRHIAKLANQLRGINRLAGKVQREESFHVTLSHIDDYVDVPDTVIDQAKKAATLVSGPAFELAFDRAASFPRGHSKPFVLRTGNSNTALFEFQKELVSAMKGVGLKVTRQKNFVPHLTLLYDDKNVGELEVAMVGWRVKEFALVISHQGESRYEIVGSWQLPEPDA